MSGLDWTYMRFGFSAVTYFARVFLTVFAVLFTASISHAAKFAGAFETTGTTPLIQNKDDGADRTLAFTLRLKSSFENGQALSVVQEYDWDMRADQKFDDSSDFVDTALKYSLNKRQLSKSISVVPSLLLVLPTSKLSRVQREIYAMTGAGVAVSVDPAALFSPNLDLDFAINLMRVMAKYDTDINGAVMNEYSSKQTINAAYHIGAATATLTFVHKNGYTFQSNLKESFEFTQEIGYDITKTATIAFGHTNAGTALKDNGNSNIALYNEAGSDIYLNFALSF